MSAGATVMGPCKIVYEITEEHLELLAEKIARKLAGADGRPDNLNMTAAGRLLGVSKDTVRRYLAAGVIRALPSLGPVRIPRSEIDRLNAENAEQGGSPLRRNGGAL